MAGNPEYDEVEAVVRIPKGERLADSRKTEGWYRGFTPKSSEKGPEHVEIRLTSREEAPTSTPEEPEIVYAYEYYEPPREKTREEEETEELLRLLVVVSLAKAAEWAQPHIRRFLTVHVVPFVAAKRERWEERRARQRASRMSAGEANASAIDVVVSSEEPPPVSTALVAYQASMTSDDARRHLVEMLIAQHFVNEKRRLLASTPIADDTVTPEVTRALQALTPAQVAKALESILASQPTVLDDLRRFVQAGDGSLHLGGGAQNAMLLPTEKQDHP